MPRTLACTMIFVFIIERIASCRLFMEQRMENAMRYYHLKYRLRMSHSVDNQREHMHKHVMEIEFFLMPKDEASMFTEFNSIEKLIFGSLDVYQEAYLNDYPEFGEDASMEHTGETIYRLITERLTDREWEVVCFEISENPLRVYIIKNEDFNMRCI